jgi:hypothetical protein
VDDNPFQTENMHEEPAFADDDYEVRAINLQAILSANKENERLKPQSPEL